MKILTFRLCGELFGIDVTSVKEINRNVCCTKVPTAPPHIVGLYNMRGQVVTIIDVAGMFGCEAKEAGWVNCVILKNIGHSHDIVAFYADTVEDVVVVDRVACKSPPENVEKNVRDNLACVYETETELLLIIDETKLFKNN